ncbi:hypothetical protein FNF29_00278 [Cafeteria roenbergensis]|uniref:Uncharacterized protein n=2 Tax=Cafeteria roenbergensis TaxID=33653 RepID=A0A5A8CYV9_CAFRO|nr:hypothetical protein FNF29_00278 [Cafeteria roenbergensis]|eukprot:KAA0157704.1 hypothetical protein FNF29_00278 [Cafeteria roenbergensis]
MLASLRREADAAKADAAAARALCETMASTIRRLALAKLDSPAVKASPADRLSLLQSQLQATELQMQARDAALARAQEDLSLARERVASQSGSHSAETRRLREALSAKDQQLEGLRGLVMGLKERVAALAAASADRPKQGSRSSAKAPARGTRGRLTGR